MNRITNAFLKRQAQILANRIGVAFVESYDLEGLAIEPESMGKVSLAWQGAGTGRYRIGGIHTKAALSEHISFAIDLVSRVPKLADHMTSEQYLREIRGNPKGKSVKHTRGTIHKNPKYPVHKPPYKVQIDEERDNFDIWLSDRDDGAIAHWHDDEARAMIEDGFFVGNKGKKRLADSVVEYARSIGMIK